jgi:hypothetical protein
MTDAALLVLQNPADLEKVRGLCSEISPAASHDVYQPISIIADALSDGEQEKYPVPLTFVGIKAEPEVSWVSVSMLGELHKHKYPRFTNTRFM